MINKMLKLIIVTSFFLGLVSMPLKAEQKIGIGIIGNLASFDSGGTETETTGDKESTTTDVNETAEFGSIFAEIQQKTDSLGITLGLEYIPGTYLLGSKSRTDAESPADRDGDDGTYTGKAEVSNLSTLYVEPTYYVEDNWGIYLKAGVSYVSVDTLETLPNSSYGNKDIFGGMYGIGVRASLADGMFFKLEYAKTDYQSLVFQSSTGNKNKVTADIDQEALKLAVGYAF